MTPVLQSIQNKLLPRIVPFSELRDAGAYVEAKSLCQVLFRTPDKDGLPSSPPNSNPEEIIRAAEKVGGVTTKKHWKQPKITNFVNISEQPTHRVDYKELDFLGKSSSPILDLPDNVADNSHLLNTICLSSELGVDFGRMRSPVLSPIPDAFLGGTAWPNALKNPRCTGKDHALADAIEAEKTQNPLDQPIPARGSCNNTSIRDDPCAHNQTHLSEIRERIS